MGKDHKVLAELLIVLVLVGFGLWGLKKNPDIFSGNKLPSEQVVTEDRTTGSVYVNNTVPTLDYGEALKQYKNARIQLDKDCRASLTNSTYKNNSYVMIDNRSDKTRTVKVGSVFPIKPWGFKIVKLSSSTLPTIWYVDCDNSQNVATISIQR